MLNIREFYDEDASEQWFTMQTRFTESLHKQLTNRGYSLITKDNLYFDHSQLTAPCSTTTLSFADSVPTPTPDYKVGFIAGRTSDFNSIKIGHMSAAETLEELLGSYLTGNKYIMSLSPKAYLLATSTNISLEDIICISRVWTVDCFIGVFDDAGQTMAVFSEEFGVTHISTLAPSSFSHLERMTTLSRPYLNDEFGRYAAGRYGGEASRFQEYFNSAINPFL